MSQSVLVRTPNTAVVTVVDARSVVVTPPQPFSSVVVRGVPGPRGIQGIPGPAGGTAVVTVGHFRPGWPGPTDFPGCARGPRRAAACRVGHDRRSGASGWHRRECAQGRPAHERGTLRNGPGGHDASRSARPGEGASYWTATGAQFKHPYVFKTLFSHEPLEFKDLCETKEVKGKMYIDYSVDKPSYSSETSTEPVFIGRVGDFCPMKEGAGGGSLFVIDGDKRRNVAGTSDRLWMSSDMVKTLHKEDDIDMDYFRQLADAAMENIGRFGDVERFIKQGGD